MKELKDIEVVISQAMDKLKVPGSQVAIVKDGKVIFSQAFGLADREKDVAMTTEHMLPIGSSSKAFTATAAVMLAQEGKIDLDKPIRNYLPEFEMSDPVASSMATPRDLLSHRTGMPRHDLEWINWYEITRPELVNRVRYLKSNQPFRSVWQYQNHMFATVGYLIEKLSNKSWEKFVSDRIMKPLKIKNFSFEVEKTKDYARLYTENLEGEISENEPLSFHAMGPAGSINSTAEDMAKWVLFNLNKGKVGRKQLIDDSLFSELHRPNIPYQSLPFTFDEVMPIGYGLGWMVDSYRGYKNVHHGGNVNGATSFISMIPEKNLGIVVLTNANQTMFGMALASHVFDRYLGFADKKDWFEAYDSNFRELMDQMREELKQVFQTKVENAPARHKLEEYCGTYTNPGYRPAEVLLKDDQLYLAYNHYEFPLEHLHYDIFTFVHLDMTFTVNFRTGVDGQIESLAIPFEGAVDPIEFAKTVEQK